MILVYNKKKGKKIKQSLLDAESTVLKVATLDEFNETRDLVKTKNTESRNWIINSDSNPSSKCI